MACAFLPSRLHVLVVDGDPLCRGVLERMLKQCQYKVTTCNMVSKALALLQENDSKFNIIMSEVHLPNEDGFKLLEFIGLELDLPVIMMSSNEEMSTVLKGIIHGACDYLIKPVRMQELKNIWQHVVHRMGKHVSRKDSYGEPDESCAKPSDFLEGGGGGRASITTSKKRKEKVQMLSDEIIDDISNLRKEHVMWSVHLHQQFVNAVNELGIENAMPRRVLEIMNVQGLTRENVASHLQKYRLYLKRLSGLESTPCSIASFQAWKDGAHGGMMHLVPGRKSSSIKSRIKGLNLGAGLGVGAGTGKSLDAETKESLWQFKMQEQQRAANQAQVFGALGLVDCKTHRRQSTSSTVRGGLHRMCSLDLQYLLKETPPLEELTTPSPSSPSITTDLSMSNNNNKKKNRVGSGNDDRVGEFGAAPPRSRANRWIERTHSGSQVEELNMIRGRLLQGSLERLSASETMMKLESIQKVASASELPPLSPPKSASSYSSSNHFPDMIQVLTTSNAQDEAFSDLESLPNFPDGYSELRLETLLDVSDYVIDDSDLLEH